MKLFLLRHGKAVENTVNQKDYDRGLSPKGLKQSKKIGKFLKNNEISYALISPSKRTQETFDIVNDYLKIEDVHKSEKLYLASSGQINEVINAHVTPNNVLLVGHNFGISELIDFYTGIDIILPTGTLAIIEFDAQSTAHFSQFSGRLLEVISPKNL